MTRGHSILAHCFKLNLNASKSTHTQWEKIHHVLLQLWRQKLGCVDTETMSGSYQKMQYAIFSKPSLSEHICLRLVLFLKNNFKVLCTATYLCCTSDVCLQAAGMPALIFKGYLNSLFVNKLCWLHNTLACEHFRKREGHNSASVELGIRSNDFNRVTQGIGPLFQWELWFKVVFPVSFLHTGLP